MAFLASLIPGLISGIFGTIGQNQAVHAAQQAANQQAQSNVLAARDLRSALDQADSYNAGLAYMGKQIMKNPMGGPLGPIINSIMNNYRNAGMSQINSAMNQLGPGMANPSGSLQDMLNSLLTGGANYASQAMGTAEQAGLGLYETGTEAEAQNRQMLGQGLASIWGPGGVSSQYQQTGSQIAQNLAQQGSPWTPIISALQDPTAQSALGGWLSRMFPGLGGGSAAANNQAGLSGFVAQGFGDQG